MQFNRCAKRVRSLQPAQALHRSEPHGFSVALNEARLIGYALVRNTASQQLDTQALETTRRWSRTCWNSVRVIRLSAGGNHDESGPSGENEWP